MDRRFCTACGAVVSEGTSFCGSCGAAIQAAGLADPAVAPPAEMPAVPHPVGTPTDAPPAAPPSAGMPATPPPMATPAYAPPPVPSSNTPWAKIGIGILGAGAIILGLVQIYNAFFGAPISSSAARQMENQIRSDFQARGQQVSQVQLTPQDRDRMTGYVTVGNAAAPGSELRYNCTANRQDGSYFRYRCEPASGTPANQTPMSMTPTAAPMTPMGAPAPAAGNGPGSLTLAQRFDMVAQCTAEEGRQVPDAAAFCSCAVDRMVLGDAPITARSACATQLGITAPR